MKRYNIAAVSYLNTKPLLHGIALEKMEKELNLSIDYPAKCAEKLLKGEVDFALVPVAVIPQLSSYHLVSDYCIGCDGAVQTVCIYSNEPLEKINEIYTDFHSRTSNELAKILLREYWKMDIPFYSLQASAEKELGQKSAIIAIGDKTIDLAPKFKYEYDLGEAWKKLTGLPFVFAAWISLKPIPEDFEARLNSAFKKGIEDIDDLVQALGKQGEDFSLKMYFDNYIDYHLDAKKKEALQLYLEKIKENKESYFPELSLA